jgi:hypothetical protein
MITTSAHLPMSITDIKVLIVKEFTQQDTIIHHDLRRAKNHGSAATQRTQCNLSAPDAHLKFPHPVMGQGWVDSCRLAA